MGASNPRVVCLRGKKRSLWGGSILSLIHLGTSPVLPLPALAVSEPACLLQRETDARGHCHRRPAQSSGLPANAGHSASGERPA